MENIKETTCCEDCPFSYEDQWGLQCATDAGIPEDRYNINEGGWIKKIPDNCPLKDGSITVKLG